MIHSFIFLHSLDDTTGGLAGFFIASDKVKDRQLLYFEIDQIIMCLQKVAEDDIVYLYQAREEMGKPMKTVVKSNRHPDGSAGLSISETRIRAIKS